MHTATNSAIQAAQIRKEKQTRRTKPRRVGSGGMQDASIRVLLVLGGGGGGR